ncbi:ubiquinone biosynthesis protein COQ7 domain-containing protein [Trichoderma ceciliae]
MRLMRTRPGQIHAYQFSQSPPIAMAPTRCLARQASCLGKRLQPATARPLSTSAILRATTSSTSETASSASAKKLKPLTQEQRDYLSSALRVNQAGELAATLIYSAQSPLIIRKHPHLRPLMAHMYDQEVAHFSTFNSLVHKHRVRPTALYPLWSVLASGLGWSTALMGREAAMACTEAVETEIGIHYNEQIRSILEMIADWEAQGYDVSGEIKQLVNTLRRIRDEELEHLDHAVENDAKRAEPHWLLTNVIRAGCRGAIWVSEKV